MPLPEENTLQSGVGETRFSKRLGTLAPPSSGLENKTGVRELSAELMTAMNKSSLSKSVKDLVSKLNDFLIKSAKDVGKKLTQPDFKSEKIKEDKEEKKAKKAEEDSKMLSHINDNLKNIDTSSNSSERMKGFDLDNIFSVKNMGRLMKLRGGTEESGLSVLTQQVKGKFLDTISEKLKATEIPVLEKYGADLDRKSEEVNRNLTKRLEESGIKDKELIEYEIKVENDRVNEFRDVETKLNEIKSDNDKKYNEEFSDLTSKLTLSIQSLEKSIRAEDDEKVIRYEKEVRQLEMQKKELRESKITSDEKHQKTLEITKEEIYNRSTFETASSDQATTEKERMISEKKSSDQAAIEKEKELSEKKSSDRLVKANDDQSEESTDRIVEVQEQTVEAINTLASSGGLGGDSDGFDFPGSDKRRRRKGSKGLRKVKDLARRGMSSAGRVARGGMRLGGSAMRAGASGARMLGSAMASPAGMVAGAGIAGVAVGTAFNKWMTEKTGRGDWALSYFANKRDRKQEEKQAEQKEILRKKAETNVKKMASKEAFELGKDEDGIWQVEKHMKLRQSKSIVFKDSKFVTSDEYNEDVKTEDEEVQKQKPETVDESIPEITQEPKPEPYKVTPIPTIDTKPPSSPGTDSSSQRIEKQIKAVKPEPAKPVIIEATGFNKDTKKTVKGLGVAVPTESKDGLKKASVEAENKAREDIVQKAKTTNISDLTFKKIDNLVQDSESVNVKSNKTFIEDLTNKDVKNKAVNIENIQKSRSNIISNNVMGLDATQKATPTNIETSIDSSKSLKKEASQAEKVDKLVVESRIKNGVEPQLQQPSQPVIINNNQSKDDEPKIRRVTRIDDPGTIILNSNLM